MESYPILRIEVPLTLANPTYRIVVSWQKKSGIEKDAIMNTFHYEGPSAPNSTQYSAWITNYYNWLRDPAPFTGFAPMQYMSEALAVGANAFQVEFFRLPASPGSTGSPLQTFFQSWSEVWPVANPLPNEVAMCLTLQSFVTGSIPEEGPGDIRPAGRRRNRVYIGPLNIQATTPQATTKEPEINDSCSGSFVYGYGDKMVTAQQAAGWTPVCFSRANWDAHRPVVVWADNAFDTQRRRGEVATRKISTNV